MFKLLALAFSLLLAAGCSSGTSNPDPLQQSKNSGAIANQQKSMETASISAVSVLTALGVTDGSELDSLIGSKNLQVADLDCATAIDVTLTPFLNGGAINVEGDCAVINAEQCSYQFTGVISFFSFILDGTPLQGSFNVNMQINFPGCGSNSGQVEVLLQLDGSVTSGSLQMLTIEATMTLATDSLTGELTPSFASFFSLATFQGLNCIATEDSSACFVDEDNDLLDDDLENCPGISNPAQTDFDADGVGDACDNCPITPNADQIDADGDGRGDVCAQVCAPGLELCATGADCSNPELLCISGCCQGTCPVGTEESPLISMTCHEADQLNAQHGLTGGCAQFHHSCSEEGCCVLPTFPDPAADFCDEDFSDPFFETCQNGAGFCTASFGRYICLLFPDGSDPNCPIFDSDFPVNADCSVYGQEVCNDFIAQGLGSKNLSCNGVCCAEPQ